MKDIYIVEKSWRGNNKIIGVFYSYENAEQLAITLAKKEGMDRKKGTTPIIIDRWVCGYEKMRIRKFEIQDS